MRIRNIKDKKDILKSSSYVIENPKDYKEKWNTYFKNNNPIHLEIGTGKCTFIYNMAKNNKNINFIGIERIDTVLALGIKEIENEEKLHNLVLINYDANYLDDILGNEVEKLYLNFSDPWPKNRHQKRRLTSFSFLEKYDIIFKGDKKIEMKTDNKDLFEFSLVSLSEYGYKLKDISLDLHNKKDFNNIMTEYEKKFTKKGCKIFYLNVEKNI